MYRHGIEITLRIWHPDQDPDLISQTLQLSPTLSYRAGQQRLSPKGKPLGSLHRETLWTHDLEVETDQSLAHAIDAMDQLLSARHDAIEALREQGARVECYVGIFLDGNRTEELSSDVMARFAKSCASLVLNIYAPNR